MNDRVEGNANDSLYSFTGLIEEVDADITDRANFAYEAGEVAKHRICVATEKYIDLDLLTCEVADGMFTVVCREIE